MHGNTIDRSKLYLIEGPAQAVLTLEEVKTHLRVNSDVHDDDSLIDAITTAAEQDLDGADGYLGRCLVSQTWELRLPGFLTECIRVPLPPLLEVQSVKYYDAANALQTLATTHYTVNGIGARQAGSVELNYGYTWPDVYERSEAVLIRFRAGYVDTSASPDGSVPAPIKQAMLLTIGDLYENREAQIVGTTISRNQTAEALLSLYRVPFFA